MDLRQYMTEAEGVVKEWESTLMSEDAPSINSTHRLVETAKMLANQKAFNEAQVEALNESTPTNVAGNIARWDPIMISMVRRAAPVLMAFDFGGVQTMNGPSGLIFCMTAKYGAAGNTFDLNNEALVYEPRTNFTGVTTDPVGDVTLDPFASLYTTGRGMATSVAEGNIIPEMSFNIDKITVEAKERQLKGSYTVELQQDMRVQHNMDAEAELANIMSMELLGEMNREFVRTLYIVAKLGSENTATPGTYDIDVDADGRWAVEKYKGLVYQLGREANAIGFDIRRGMGNKIIASPNVCTALSMAGMLDTGGAHALNREAGNGDFTKSSYVGKLNGQYDLHVDPFLKGIDSVLVAYKGDHPWDSGIYYCPYTPFQMLRATDPESFQPRIAYKTRYGMVSNPFVRKADGSKDAMQLTPAINPYFRKFKITGL